MDISVISKSILEMVDEALKSDGIDIKLSEDTALIGGKSALDSMKLVELCLALEDKAADDDFEFDWTSEEAMSKSRGMFRSISSLASEYAQQHDAQK